MEQRRTHGKAHAASFAISTGSGSSSSGGDSSGCSPSSPSAYLAAAAGYAPASAGNAFANDGSFMEMFKKKMEEEMSKKTPGASGEARATEQGQTSGDKKPPPVTSFVRGLPVSCPQTDNIPKNWPTQVANTCNVLAGYQIRILAV